MKISYNWLREFIQIDHPPEELSHILTNLGLEVENLEKIQAIPGGLEGLVIGYVKACKQHPNADRLKITQVAIAGDADLQIICGAGNIAAGQKVVVATVNTMLYPTVGEPFKIKLSKIRGEASEGMICAADEIGLGTSHDGILVLDPEAVVGTSAKSYFNIEDDYCFEIGLTPNRADAASHLGVARDLAAYLNIPITWPDISRFSHDHDRLIIPVFIEDTRACLRYSSLTMSDVTIQESPDWLKKKLLVIGVHPINNVVDATNYVLHELGQPLHAFDADAMATGEVFVKTCAAETPFVALDQVKRMLSAEDLMICHSGGPMCMAGVFGGEASGVKTTTSNIFLESAWFDAVCIRKTSKRHGLKTDASFRFERGTDPDMTVIALKRAALLIKEIAGGQISSPIADWYPSPAKPFEIAIRYAHVDRLIGKIIPRAEIKAILTGLGIQIKTETTEELQLQAPNYRVDLTREVDIIEEILRIYGYDRIAIPHQLKASIQYTAKPDKEVVQNNIADLLTANGYIEMISNSLSKMAYAIDPEKAVKLINPLSTDLDVMRQSLLFSGLEAIVYNQNRKNVDLKLYEFGKVYWVDASGYAEDEHLALLITGLKEPENWHRKAAQVNFYTLKSAVDMIFKRLNIRGFLMKDADHIHLLSGLTYLKEEKPLVQFGQVQKSIRDIFDIAHEVFYAEFNWDLLLKMIKHQKITYKEVSKFPAVRRDLSMLLDQAISFAELKEIARKTEKLLLKEVDVFDVYSGEKLPQGKKSYALSFLLQDEKGTLTEKQIEAVMQRLMDSFEKKVGAEIRKKC